MQKQSRIDQKCRKRTEFSEELEGKDIFLERVYVD